MVRRALGVLLALTLASCGIFALGDLVPIVDAGRTDVADDVADAALEVRNVGDAGDASDASDANACADANSCACAPSAQVIVAEPFGGGQGIAVSGSYVYFLASGTGKSSGSEVRIFRAPTAFTDVPFALSSSYPGSGPLVLAGNALYFRRIGTGWSILRVPLDAVDAAPIPLNGPNPLGAPPNDLGADGANVYWSNQAGQICAWPLSAPPVVDAGDGGCIGAPLVAAHDGGGPTQNIAVGGGYAFWITYSRIFRAPTATGAPIGSLVSHAPDSVGGIAESQGQIFWSEVGIDAGAILAADDDGGNAHRVDFSLFDDRSQLPTFAVDGDGVYWGNRLEKRIMAAARDGSGQRLLTCDTGVSAITTDANFVYWITPGGGVKRIAKK